MAKFSSKKISDLIKKNHQVAEILRGSFADLWIKERERLFKEACMNMDFGDQISIYRSPRYKRGNLCFNRFSLIFSLDEGEIEKYGTLRITKPAELFSQPEQD